MTQRRTVCIINPGPEYVKLFRRRGWKIVNNVKNADLVQFTGGADVTPQLYGEEPHRTTVTTPERDLKEALIFKRARDMKKPMAGICRGGQFLHVMNGGTMYQNVDMHAIQGTHKIIDVATGDTYDATSTHHQMMCLKEVGLCLAYAQEATRLNRMKGGKEITWIYAKEMNLGRCDPEVVVHDATKSLCFQPHPEHVGHDALADVYFRYIDEHCFN